ncbi:MAG TPA: RelA/SpoT family protein [Rectinemataceae bacterium]|nr:RelA/SpoT family protein [Rectinemataceae bacterium]
MSGLRDTFATAVSAAFPPEESGRIEAALSWAIAAKAGMLRASGEPAWEHNVRVASTLLEMGLDADSILAAILHDALERTGDGEIVEEGAKAGERPGESPRRKEIGERFGQEVLLLVEDVSRLAALKAKNKTVQAAETIRKMLFAMTRDIRVIIIKLADKLDSMRTLKHLEEERQKEIATECLDVFAPLADRLGISWMKDELEDLSLKAINREAFDQVKDIVAAKKEEREAYLARVEAAIRKEAGAEGISVEVSARAKHFYSIYQKMRKRAKAAEELYDLLGLRLICQGENECYALLGMVHRLWKPIDGRFKDYIAMPKANGYRSLHTTVMCFDGRLLEVQIRSFEMNRVAEYGIASHWLYKKGRSSEMPRPQDLPMVNRLREWGDFLSQGASYLEEIKRELLKDSIFVFTPRGDVIELPTGSTPLDFAYAIHTDIGSHCVGAKANGLIVPLDAELKNTQVVEILTSPQAHPNMNWLRIARTSKARSKIRSWLVQSGQALAIDRNIVAGRKVPPEGAKGDDRHAAGHGAGHGAAHGAGHGAREVEEQRGSAWPFTGIHELDEPGRSTVEFHANRPGEALRNESAGVAIGGAKNLMIRIAGCCSPVTGDDIVGYISRGRGIIVHRADCRSVRAIADFPERRIDVRWEESNAFVTVRFRLTARKSAELFSEIENAVRKFHGRLREGRLGERGDGTLAGSFTMEVESKEDVRRVVKALRAVPSVISLEEDD